MEWSLVLSSEVQVFCLVSVIISDAILIFLINFFNFFLILVLLFDFLVRLGLLS